MSSTRSTSISTCRPSGPPTTSWTPPGEVFVAEEEDELVAGLRVVPFASGHSELAQLGAPLHALDIGAEPVAVSRTVARKTRAGMSAGTALFTGAARWALGHTPYTRLVGYTRLGIIPHFQRIGLEPAGPEFTLPSRTREHYRLLVGRIADIGTHRSRSRPD